MQMRNKSNSNSKKIFDLTLYPDVQEYLERQPNMTKYIVELIRKDMNNAETIDKENIFKIIEEYLQLKGINPSEVKQEDIDNDKLKTAALKIMGKG